MKLETNYISWGNIDFGKTKELESKKDTTIQLLFFNQCFVQVFILNSLKHLKHNNHVSEVEKSMIKT